MIKAGICREHLVCIQRPGIQHPILCRHPLQNELTAYLAAVCVSECNCASMYLYVCVCVYISRPDIHALKLMPGTRK